MESISFAYYYDLKEPKCGGIHRMCMDRFMDEMRSASTHVSRIDCTTIGNSIVTTFPTLQVSTPEGIYLITDKLASFTNALLALDKEYRHTLCTSEAIQKYLPREQKPVSTSTENDDNTMSKIETQLAAIVTRLEAIETKLTDK